MDYLCIKHEIFRKVYDTMESQMIYAVMAALALISP